MAVFKCFAVKRSLLCESHSYKIYMAMVIGVQLFISSYSIIVRQRVLTYNKFNDWIIRKYQRPSLPQWISFWSFLIPVFYAFKFCTKFYVLLLKENENVSNNQLNLFLHLLLLFLLISIYLTYNYCFYNLQNTIFYLLFIDSLNIQQ